MVCITDEEAAGRVSDGVAVTKSLPGFVTAFGTLQTQFEVLFLGRLQAVRGLLFETLERVSVVHAP